MNIKITILGLSILLISSCSSKKEKENLTDIFNKVYMAENIEKQIFSIDSKIDNIITGANGTKIRINKSTFVDSLGKIVTGKIDIELKEALKPIDMILGNLITTFEGKPLESGGMIYIDAKIGNDKLAIGNNKSILIAVKTDSMLSKMSLFEGQQDSTGIKWQNPVAIQDNFSDTSTISMGSFERTTNITYGVDGFVNEQDSFPEIVNSEVSRIAWEGDGLKITKDSVLKIDKYTVRFYKNKKLQTWSEVFEYRKGINSYMEDRKTNYIFSIKKLGWANIDRLLADPRTQEVELITKVENQGDFKGVYITMITPKMYLSGYQKKDNSYCFSHGDDEKMQLPIGEIVTILATAYKNDKPYFAMQKLTITNKQNLSLNLIETTTENLKKELMSKI
jgi:hypothetical protein